VTVSDKFFERIGIDFDFNMQGTAPVPPNTRGFGDFLPPFGNGTNFQTATTGTTTSGQTTSGQTTSGSTTSGTTTSGTTTAGTGTGTGPFTPGPPRDLVRRGDYPKLGTIVGLDQQLTFSNDLQIPFRQGSFDVGIPDFGSFKPDAGLSMGFAILSDIETFFFIQAAQGDSRSNILFAPKVTLFNGQLANVQDTLNRPFVVGQTPVVGAFTVAFTPNVEIFTEGVTLLVSAVVSADRRYVRLSLVPRFTAITDVFTFTFSGAAGASGQQGGGTTTGFQGNNGSIGGGGGSGQAQGGTSGGQTSGGQTSGGQTSGGQTTSGQTTAGSVGNIVNQPATQTLQQPVQEIISIQTAVSVPDGGTVLLGGVKRLKEGRNMAGVPILNKIPYISRLFKNSGVGRETDSLMMMVTPRIIIQEEEEELLGVPL
jgi:general secretion pathway protein D